MRGLLHALKALVVAALGMVLVLPLVLIGAALVAPIVVFETMRGRRRVRRYVQQEAGRRFFVYEERDRSLEWIREHLLPLAEAERLTEVAIGRSDVPIAGGVPDTEWRFIIQKLSVGTPWVVAFEDGGVRDISLSGLVGYGLQADRTPAEIEERWTAMLSRFRNSKQRHVA